MSNELIFIIEKGNLTYTDVPHNAKIVVNMRDFRFKVINLTSKRKLWVSPRHAAIAMMMTHELEKMKKEQEKNEKEQ